MYCIYFYRNGCLVGVSTNSRLCYSVLIKYGPFRAFISLFIPPAKMLETRGFAATAPATALEMLSSLSVDFAPWIEEDQMVTANGDLSSGVNKA